MTTLRTGTLGPSDLEVRSDGRTVFGIAAPYGVEARVKDHQHGWVIERMEHGVTFTRGLDKPQRVKVYVNHNHREGHLPVGVATLLRDDPVGLYTELRFAETDAAQEAVELVRSGITDHLSVGYLEDRKADRWEPGNRAVVRANADLREVSVVPMPAFDGADVLGVRDHADVDRAATARAQAIAIRHRLLTPSYRSRP